MSIEDEARAEAEKRYPATLRYDGDEFPNREAGAQRQGWFERGEWQTSRKVEAAPAKPVSDTDRALWEKKSDGSIGATEHGHDVWNGRTSQPVQVEVTDEMVEKAAQAFGGLTVTRWSSTEEWERNAVRSSMRRALSAALTPTPAVPVPEVIPGTRAALDGLSIRTGGGDHAE